MGGGKGGGDAEDAARVAGKMAEQLYYDTAPMRQKIIGNAENFLQGGYDVSQNPVFGAGRNVLEDQYNVARENIISNTPRGGALTEGMADLEMSRAKSLSDLTANVSQDEYNKAYGMATGTPQQSMGALTNVAGSMAAANAQQNAGKYGALGDLGMGAGYVLGSK